MEQKFLDKNGVAHLFNKLSLQDYPNNETLMSVINAIDETKADKNELPKLQIKTVAYDIETVANEYVLPYKYYLRDVIPEEDIELYGEPISITAWGQSHEPALVTWYGSARREYAVATYYNSTCRLFITYAKLV